MIELDIRSTIRKVCQRVINDNSIDRHSRYHRLEALKILGELYMKFGGSMKTGLTDLTNRFGNILICCYLFVF